MTIASQVNKVLYSGTGGTVYPYTFKIFSPTDLVVVRRAVDGVENVLVLSTDYKVSGVGSDTGGSVILQGEQAETPPATGEKLLVKRVIPLTQSTDWVENDDFPAQVIENAMDRVICISQQQQEQIDRCLKVGETSSLSGTIDPDQIAANAAAAAMNAQAAASSAGQAAASAASVSPGAAGGVATLDNSGQVPETQLANAVTPGSSIFLTQNYTCLMY
ncbi:MAG: hypothetical protein HY795_05830 [Desulfovibrio sp.]|nr:hypothetical protein [Desulfovibrio sp.]MBI4961352.1 hypothetical protein [Desulfovibrio sp.]